MTLEQAERALTPVFYSKIKEGERIDISEHLHYPGDNLASPDTRDLVLLQGTVDLFEETRKLAGVPIPVNAGYRSHAWQERLKAQGYKASTISPHEHGAALDLSVKYIDGLTKCKRAQTLIKYLCDAARNLGLREFLRYGSQAYGWNFVHVDIVPLLFAPQWKEVQDAQLSGLANFFYPYGRTNPNPNDWRSGVTW